MHHAPIARGERNEIAYRLSLGKRPQAGSHRVMQGNVFQLGGCEEALARDSLSVLKTIPLADAGGIVCFRRLL